nr:hypothetical protein TetV2_00031 [Oceanusvirus sp.]
MSAVLEECETLLGNEDVDSSHETEIKRKAHSRIEVLAGLARKTCELAMQGGDRDPVRAIRLTSSVNALVGGIDNVHRLLRQAVPDADEVLKQMSAVKKGPYRNMAHDVETLIEYTEPVAWAAVPALRVIVQTLKDLEDLALA